MNRNRAAIRLFVRRIKHLGQRQFILILSVLIGLATGIAAFILKYLVHLIESLLTSEFSLEYRNLLYFAYPAIGIFLTVIFIKYLLKQDVGDGVPKVLHSIAKWNGKMRLHNVYSSLISSALTVGFGGSVGLEGPTVATGGAIGSNISKIFHLNYKQTVLLVGCASVGAMSAIFKSPIAAIVFGIEVIMLDLTMSSIIPLLVSSITAALTSYILLGQDVLYSFVLKESFIINDVPYYIIFGVITGFISLYNIRVYVKITDVFKKIKKWYIKVLIGGLVLGLLIFLFPTLYGEGYSSINSSLNGDYSFLYNNSIFYSLKDNMFVIFLLLALIASLKIVATSITFGAGGIGGFFAPTLFSGAITGLLFALAINYSGFHHLSESNFILVGMAGLISGVIHAPLTAIFLIAEITNGYGLLLPLMIVSTISYATIKFFEPNSVYTIQLAKCGDMFTHDKDKTVLSLMKVKNHLETNFSTVNIDSSLGELVKIISNAQRNVFPVIDKDNNYKGIVFLDDIRHIIFQPEKYDKVFVRDIMFVPDVYVDINESMEEVADKFRKSGNYNLPVLSNGKYLGFISRANVFLSYRTMLKDFSED
ncbi:MAG: chloride channel protein [Bacteroidales bacterium]|nr:chloride channel protein [Bacteroidales bacterium]